LLGLPWSVRVDTGDHPERPAAYDALCELPLPTERVSHLVIDGGYAGISFEGAVHEICPDVDIETTRRSKGEFVLAKKRWALERTFAWLAGFRRLDVNRERTCRSAREMLVFCLVLFMLANVG
jgi:putative transposase